MWKIEPIELNLRDKIKPAGQESPASSPDKKNNPTSKQMGELIKFKRNAETSPNVDGGPRAFRR